MNSVDSAGVRATAAREQGQRIASQARIETERTQELTLGRSASLAPGTPTADPDRHAGLERMPSALLSLRVADFLEFDERACFGMASKAIAAAMASGSSHPVYAQFYQAKALLRQLQFSPVANAEQLAAAVDNVARAKGAVSAERTGRKHTERQRAEFAATKASWARTVEGRFAASPQSAIAASDAVQLLCELGRPHAAIGLAKWRLANFPTDAFACRQLAEAYLQARLPDEACSQARVLLAMTPADQRARVVMARALMLKGDFSSSLAALNDGPVLDALTLSMVKDSLGHPEESAAALRLHRHKNRGLPASARVAEVHAWRGELDAARACIEEVISHNIHHADLSFVAHSPFAQQLWADERGLSLLKRMNRAPDQLCEIPFTFHLP